MARPHKVLFVIPNLQQGGAERQILQLANRLPERFQPALCLFDDNVHYKEELARLPTAPRVVGASRMGPAAYRRLVAIIREEKPDIVQTYRDIANFWGRLAALKAGVPVVVTSVRNRALNLINVLTERWLARRTARVLTNSEGVRRELTRLARVPDSKIQVVHNFIDVERFVPPSAAEREQARARWGVAEDETILLVPGRIATQKHQLGLLFALNLLRRRGGLPPRARVLLAGRENSRLYPALVNRSLRWLGLTDRVTYLGRVTDMISLYAAADILVLPSLFEGLPNAVLEGAACGLPAVVSHAANVDRLVVDGETGFEVPTFNRGALADALGRCLALAPEERRRIGAAGRAHIVAHFGPDRIRDEMTALYDSLLRERGLA
jgi:glycosyltransferase involved in cell wall biosynthesis